MTWSNLAMRGNVCLVSRSWLKWDLFEPSIKASAANRKSFPCFFFFFAWGCKRIYNAEDDADVEIKTTEQKNVKFSSSRSFFLWNHKHVHVQKHVWCCSCSWSVASSCSLNKAAGYKGGDAKSLHSACCYASSETVQKTHTRTLEKRLDQTAKKKITTTNEQKNEDTVGGTLNTTQHSCRKNDAHSVNNATQNGITLYIYNAG